MNISLRGNIKVEDVPDSATRYKVEFRVYSPSRTIILFAMTGDQKHLWLKAINTSIQKYKDAPPVSNQIQVIEDNSEEKSE